MGVVARVQRMAKGAAHDDRRPPLKSERRFCRLLQFWALALFASLTPAAQALGQTKSVDDYPVLQAAPDGNGVDLTTRSMVVRSPLRIAEPGASHLGVNLSIKGTHLAASINYYITDNTVTTYGGSTEYRYVNVTMGSADRMFYCAGNGVCDNLVNIDGTKLERFTGNIYKLTDKDGTQVNFFAPVIQAITPCNPNNGEISCSSYSAYAHASSIKFANGEKLTFSPLASFFTKNSVQHAKVTVTSNLGYTLAIAYPYPSQTQSTGGHWTRAIAGDDDVISYELYRGLNRIEGLEVSKTRTNYYLDHAYVTDDLSRTYSVAFENRALQNGCGGVYTLPVQVISPGGVQKSVVYPSLPVRLGSSGPDAWPVGTVTVGQSTWTYSLETVSGVPRVVVTDPLGGIRRIRSVSFQSPIPNVSSTCGNSGMGGQITRDEIGATSSTAGNAYTYAYDANARIIQANRPEMDGFSYTRDARDNVTEVTALKKTSSTQSAFTTYQASYATTCSNPVTCNSPAWKKDANGNVTDYTYDSVHGGVLTEMLPADGSGKRVRTSYTYAPSNTGDGIIYRVSEKQTCYYVGGACSGVVSTTAYTYWSSTFLPATVTESASDTSATLVTSYVYDEAGRPVQITNPNGGVTLRRYDAAGRLTGEISPSTGTTQRLARQVTYNADDQILTEEFGTTSGTDWNSFASNRISMNSYNAIGQRTQAVLKDGTGVAHTLTQYSYDTTGRLECTAVRMNPGAYGSLPSSACTLGTAGSYGPDRITRNYYDAASQLVQKRVGYSSTVEAVDVTYSYTLNGKIEYVIDANGNRAKLEYDGFDRQSKWIFPSTTLPTSYNPSTQANALSTAGSLNTSDYEQYTYDANGNRLTLRKRDGQTLIYTYDALNRMTKKDVPGTTALDVYYAYDLRGLQTYARFGSANGEGITYAYDGFGRRTSEIQGMDGTSRLLTSAYDPDGHRTQLTYGGVDFLFYYDGVGRLHYAQTGGLGLFHPVYNAAGNATQLNRGNLGTFTWGTPSNFTYDPVSRLASLGHDIAGTTYDTSTSFTRNPASQLVSRASSNAAYAWNGYTNTTRDYASNGLNQYNSVVSNSNTAEPATLMHDANGNLSQSRSKNPAGQWVTTTYTYDPENRLVASSLLNEATSQVISTTLRYDPLGRLYEVNDSITGLTRFLNDGDALVAEYNASGTMLRRYVHGDSTGDDPLVVFDGPSVAHSARYYMYSDERGSIVAVTDVNGTVQYINTYDEYGIPGANNQGRFQYTGQAWIPELGMYYYKARMYSPTLGRFMQTDPIGYEDQFNLYTYVGNDPVNGIDPSGEKVVVYGTRAEREALKAAMREAIMASPELRRRHVELVLSKYTHEVRFGGDPNDDAAAQSTPTLPGHARREGMGSPTKVVIDDVYSDSDYADSQGRDAATMVAHELYGHSYDSDRGELRDLERNPQSRLKEAEHSAMKAENMFNEGANRPEEKCYGGRPLDGISPC